MYTELEFYDKDVKISELENHTFAAISAGIGGFAVTPFLLPYVKDFVPYGYVISCPIDYPYGVSDIPLRSHAILSAISRGANSIDLPINIQAANNQKYDVVSKDIETQKTICDERSIPLRIMLDYRFMEYQSMLDVKKILKEHNIMYVLPSTGIFMDNIHDNILFGKILEKDSLLSVISNAQITSISEYKKILEQKPFGIRFKSYHIMKMCLVNNI